MPTLIISQINARWTGHGTGVTPGLKKPEKSTILPLPLRYRRRPDFYQVIDATGFLVFMQYAYRCLRSFRVIFMQYYYAAFFRPSWYHYRAMLMRYIDSPGAPGRFGCCLQLIRAFAVFFLRLVYVVNASLCQSGAWSREINGLKKY